MDYLFGLLGEALDGGIPGGSDRDRVSQLASAFADGIRRFVRFAAEHPELNQIMVHEGTAASDRLAWMTETHVKPVFDGIRPAWQMLRKAGVAAPIDHEILYYVLVGAASLPYVNAPRSAFSQGGIRRIPNGSMLMPPRWLPSSCQDRSQAGLSWRTSDAPCPWPFIFRWRLRVLLLHGYSNPWTDLAGQHA